MGKGILEYAFLPLHQIQVKGIKIENHPPQKKSTPQKHHYRHVF